MHILFHTFEESYMVPSLCIFLADVSENIGD